MKEKRYYYEYFKKKFGRDIERGKCFKNECARYRREIGVDKQKEMDKLNVKED